MTVVDLELSGEDDDIAEEFVVDVKVEEFTAL